MSAAAAASSENVSNNNNNKKRPRAAVDDDEGSDRSDTDNDDGYILPPSLYRAFDEHVQKISAARAEKRERLAFKSAAEQCEEMKDADKVMETEDDRDRLGEWLPDDRFQGQVNMRTLKALLSRVDRRGFERSSQQLEFHEAFFRACGRVIYKDTWATDKPAIMRTEGWTKCNSEVLISTPRRFGSVPLTTSRTAYSTVPMLCWLLVAGRHSRLQFFARVSLSVSGLR